jgi:hypothetical protein
MAIFNILKTNKVIYYDGPKCGSTTMLAYATLIHNPDLLLEVNALIKKGLDSTTAYNNCRRGKKNLYTRRAIVKETLIKEENIPPDAIKFCIVRDPVERFISVYKSLVLYGRYVTSKDVGIDEFIKIIDLDKSTLKDWTDVSDIEWRAVKFHFLPQVQFYGTDPTIFTHIFNIKQMEEVKQLLEQHSGITLPSLQANWSRKIEISLTESQIDWIKKRYARDYEFYKKWMK